MNWTTLTKEQKIKWLKTKSAELRQFEKVAAELADALDQWLDRVMIVQKRK